MYKGSAEAFDEVMIAMQPVIAKFQYSAEKDD
jgi:hypothetical protein